MKQGMTGLWLENRQLSLRHDLPLPTPTHDETLVKIRAAGICGTDLALLQGYYPFSGIPGHEFVGELADGQRVVGEINLSCGECAECCAGRPRHCSQRQVLGINNRHGVFAQYTTLPRRNLHAVPDAVPDEAAALCEPLAAALHIAEQVNLAGQRVVLIGAGRLGLLIAAALHRRCGDFSAGIRHAAQRDFLQRRGIAWREENALPARQFDVIIEASGTPGGFELARSALRPRGTLVLKSTYAGKLSANFSSLVVDEITLIGSRCGPFEPALRFLQQDTLADLIAAQYRLEDGVAAFARAAEKGVLKVLLNIMPC
jgi:threonine dehydrogenase-like Zn-dependent dehydrogenase